MERKTSTDLRTSIVIEVLIFDLVCNELTVEPLLTETSFIHGTYYIMKSSVERRETRAHILFTTIIRTLSSVLVMSVFSKKSSLLCLMTCSVLVYSALLCFVAF